MGSRASNAGAIGGVQENINKKAEEVQSKGPSSIQSGQKPGIDAKPSQEQASAVSENQIEPAEAAVPAIDADQQRNQIDADRQRRQVADRNRAAEELKKQQQRQAPEAPAPRSTKKHTRPSNAQMAVADEIARMSDPRAKSEVSAVEAVDENGVESRVIVNELGEVVQDNVEAEKAPTKVDKPSRRATSMSPMARKPVIAGGVPTPGTKAESGYSSAPDADAIADAVLAPPADAASQPATKPAQNMPEPAQNDKAKVQDRGNQRQQQPRQSQAPQQAQQPEVPQSQREKVDERWAKGLRARLKSKDFENLVRPRSRYYTSDDYRRDLADRNKNNPDWRQFAQRNKKQDPKRDRAVSRIMNELIGGYFHIKGEYLDESERLRYPAEADVAITRVQGYFGWGPSETRDVFTMVRLYAGLSTDRQGRLFNDAAENFEMKPEDFAKTCNLIIESCERFGHPFGIVDTNFRINGTRRFPIGVCPAYLAKKMTRSKRSKFYGRNPEEIARRSMNAWMNRTYPELRKNLQGEKAGQVYVLEDMVRAAAALDGVSPSVYGVKAIEDFTYEEYMSRDAAYAAAAYGLFDANEVNREQAAQISRAEKRLMDRNYRVSTVIDENGGKHTMLKNRNVLNRIGSSSANLMRVMGVAGNLPLMGAGILEKAKGNVLTKVTGKLALGVCGYKTEQFALTSYTKAFMRQPETIEALSCINSLHAFNGQDAVVAFASTGKSLNPQNVVDFVNSYKYSGKDPDLLDKAADWASNVGGKLIVGDYFMKESDALRWCEGLMLTYQRNAKYQQDYLNGNGVPGYRPQPAFTISEVDSMMRAMGPADFILKTSATPDGANARCFARGNNLGMESPLGYAIKSWMTKHGVMDATVTAFVDTYLIYGINLGQMLLPYTKTFSYLATKGVVKAEGKAKAKDLANGTSYEDVAMMGSDIADHQLGGNMRFMEGFKLNLLYDSVQFANNAVMTAVFSAIIMALGGVKPPKEEEDFYNLSMWTIGDVEIQPAWWVNDLVLWQWPAAVALCANAKYPEKSGLFWDLFFDGFYDMASGASFMDFAEMIPNAKKDWQNWQDAMTEDGYEGPNDIGSYALLELELALAKGTGKFVPSFLRPSTYLRDTAFVGTSAREKDAYKAYDYSDDWHRENNATTSVSWEDAQRRMESKNNILYGGFLNLAQWASSWNTGGPKVSGYQWWEMPSDTKADPLSIMWMDRYSMDYSNPPDGMDSVQYAEFMAQKVIEDINSFDSIEEAKDKHYMIPDDARRAAMDYCGSMVNMLDNNYCDQLESGELADYETGTVIRLKYQAEREKWTSLFYDWLVSEDVPSWYEPYEKILTDYEYTYRYKDTHEPAPITEAMNPNVEVVRKNKGDHPTSFLPFTTVDTNGRGYNAETIPLWFDPGENGTDNDEIREMIGDAVYPYGNDAGTPLVNVLYGEGADGEYTHPFEPTIGERSYLPTDYTLSDWIREYDLLKDATGLSLGEAGQYNDDTQEYLKNPNYEGKNATSEGKGGSKGFYPSSSYRVGGSSGGSAYNPKIYSNPRSINADRAATMGVQRPYGATRDYLNPGFSTKGSREAYKRQDI